MQTPKTSRRRPYLVADDAYVDALVARWGLFDTSPEPLALNEDIYQWGDEVSRVELSRQEVMDMLRQAGAPEPWHSAEACAAIRVTKLPTFVQPQTREGEVQYLVAKLRSKLTPLIRTLRDDIEDPFGADDVAQLSKEIDIWQRLLDAAEMAEHCTWEARYQPDPVKCSWHSLAVQLLKFYRLVVDPSFGISADGPAVRFIEAALNRFEIQGGRTRHAIAKALQRAAEASRRADGGAAGLADR
jgi:hypothetical protein